MKRTVLALKRPTHIGGKIVDAGTVVATVESSFNVDSIFSLASQNGLQEVSMVELPGESEQTAGEPQAIELPADDALVDDAESVESLPVAEPPAVVEQSATAGTLLSDAGMSEALYSRLAVNNIHTVEQLKEFLAKGGDLVDLEDIGTTYAKRITGWLNSRN